MSGRHSPTRWFHRFWTALFGAIRGYGRHGDGQPAAAIAFRVLFSLVPLVALAVAIADLLVPDARREDLVEWIIETLAGSTGLEESIRRALTQGAGVASVVGLVALGGLIWAASGMIGCDPPCIPDGVGVRDP